MSRRHILISIVVLMIALAGYYFVRPLFDYFVVTPARAASRAHESLPKMSIDSDGIVYCRMQYRDFRFPLPPGAHVAQTDTFKGGPDYVNGVIYVTNSDGSLPDLEAYEVLLQQHDFIVRPDYKSEAAFAAGGRDGGAVEVYYTGNRPIKIGFSYWGDD